MIEIKIKHRHCKIHLILNDKITVIIGSSGTGKSTIHKALTKKEESTQIKISDNRYKLEQIVDRQYMFNILRTDNTLPKNTIYIIDEGTLEIDDEIANILQHSIQVYFVITSRTKLGKLNFSLGAVLLYNLNIEVESPDKKGKEQVCNEINESLKDNDYNILAIFDACSFGACVKAFNGLIQEYGKRILLLPCLKKNGCKMK